MLTYIFNTALKIKKFWINVNNNCSTYEGESQTCTNYDGTKLRSNTLNL